MRGDYHCDYCGVKAEWAVFAVGGASVSWMPLDYAAHSDKTVCYAHIGQAVEDLERQMREARSQRRAWSSPRG